MIDYIALLLTLLLVSAISSLSTAIPFYENKKEEGDHRLTRGFVTQETTTDNRSSSRTWSFQGIIDEDPRNEIDTENEKPGERRALKPKRSKKIKKKKTKKSTKNSQGGKGKKDKGKDMKKNDGDKGKGGKASNSSKKSGEKSSSSYDEDEASLDDEVKASAPRAEVQVEDEDEVGEEVESEPEEEVVARTEPKVESKEEPEDVFVDICDGIDFSITWTTSQENVDEADGGWILTNNGRRIRFAMEVSLNCGGTSSSIQSGTAEAIIVVPEAYLLTLTIVGISERIAFGFEDMSIRLDGETVVAATSPGVVSIVRWVPPLLASYVTYRSS